ncbi:hypothetical protein Leryth_013840 [Lithospermum erythrorhizon]|nr:hypothetical protein Leryth_013840 [Lithospermum erythrorhizon]
MEASVMKTDEVVQEIMKLHRSLPTRPGIDEVEAAKTLMVNVEKEDQARIEAIGKQRKAKDVPEELFRVLQEMQKQVVCYLSNEQKREAVKLLDLENVHLVFDELIQRASKCLSGNSDSSSSNWEVKETSTSRIPHGGSQEILSSRDNYDTIKNYANSSVSSRDSSSLSLNTSVSSISGTGFSSPGTSKTNVLSSSFYNDKVAAKVGQTMSKDDSFLKKSSTTFHMDGVRLGMRPGDAYSGPHIVDSTLKASVAAGQDGDKMSLIKLASTIEVSAKKGVKELNLQSKLMEQVEWIPDSIGKLSSLISLDLSENRILVLPGTIGGLSSLEKLDLHSNRISELPESIGELLNLVHINLSGNQLHSLPPAVARLVRLQELNLSSNNLHALPDTIGSLVSLKVLDVDTNDLEEIPHTIGQCSSLRELRADYNRLKALPEAVGRIGLLEVISVRYNNIRQLPTTMASAASLKELNVSFNELESVPESLCLATTLVKMNISNNFADLRALPRNIGNLENLEELNMSNNQIRILPDSFRMLSKLRVLNVEGNPLELPPRDIIEQGAQAVVQYMVDLVENRDVKSQPVKQKKSWAQLCCFSQSNKRKRSGNEYVTT